MPRNWGPCQMPMLPRMTDNSEMWRPSHLDHSVSPGGRHVHRPWRERQNDAG
jgi:hypothetical protein